MHFVYIKVPLLSRLGQAPSPLHHALQQALDDAAAGAIVGWGTSLAAPGASEADPGSFHRVDVELHELDAGLAVLRESLTRCGAPPGTELHFTARGAALQQSLSATAWGPHVPSTGTHRPRRP